MEAMAHEIDDTAENGAFVDNTKDDLHFFKHDCPVSETTRGLQVHSSSRPSGYVG